MKRAEGKVISMKDSIINMTENHLESAKKKAQELKERAELKKDAFTEKEYLVSTIDSIGYGSKVLRERVLRLKDIIHDKDFDRMSANLIDLDDAYKELDSILSNHALMVKSEDINLFENMGIDVTTLSDDFCALTGVDDVDTEVHMIDTCDKIQDEADRLKEHVVAFYKKVV